MSTTLHTQFNYLTKPVCLFKLRNNQGCNARKVNCICEYSKYKLKTNSMGGICKQENQITHFFFSCSNLETDWKYSTQKKGKDLTRNGELSLLNKRSDRFVKDEIKRKRKVFKQTNENTRRTDNNNKSPQKI